MDGTNSGRADSNRFTWRQGEEEIKLQLSHEVAKESPADEIGESLESRIDARGDFTDRQR